MGTKNGGGIGHQAAEGVLHTPGGGGGQIFAVTPVHPGDSVMIDSGPQPLRE